jgi:hypothetical protein
MSYNESISFSHYLKESMRLNFQKPSLKNGPDASLESSSSTPSPSNWVPLCLLVTFIFGAYVRFVPTLLTGFPLNDGGLFVDMVHALEENGFRLPHFVSYNGEQIPFAYPPLGFYLAALFERFLGVPVEQFMRFFPPICSTATIPAFWLLARRLTPTDRQAALATLFFSFLPFTFSWQVMGGGLTRAPGYLFGMLTLAAFSQLFQQNTGQSETAQPETTQAGAVPRSTRLVVQCTVLLSLTSLFHAEMIKFVIFSAFLMGLFFGRNFKSALHGVAILCGTAILTAPWWGTVIFYHGMGPFRAAASTGGQGWRGLGNFTNAAAEMLWPLLMLSTLCGAVLLIKRRLYFMPVWFVMLFIVQPRSYRTFAALSLAIMVAVFIEKVLSLRPASRLPFRPLNRIAVCLLAFYAISNAYILSMSALVGSTLRPDERAALAWPKTHTPAKARFLILPYGLWANDQYSEWFPTMARRVSIATVQGTEWLPDKAFYKAWQRNTALVACLDKDASCITDWAKAEPQPFDFIYLPLPLQTGNPNAWKNAERQLRASSNWEVVYDKSGAIIFKRRQQPLTLYP